MDAFAASLKVTCDAPKTQFGNAIPGGLTNKKFVLFAPTRPPQMPSHGTASVCCNADIGRKGGNNIGENALLRIKARTPGDRRRGGSARTHTVTQTEAAVWVTSPPPGTRHRPTGRHMTHTLPPSSQPRIRPRRTSAVSAAAEWAAAGPGAGAGNAGPGGDRREGWARAETRGFERQCYTHRKRTQCNHWIDSKYGGSRRRPSPLQHTEPGAGDDV